MNLNDLHKIALQFATTQQMPILFLGHGSPMNAIEQNVFNQHWQQIGKSLPKPNAILCVSAHWETQGTKITAMDPPATIHDFGGFQALMRISYPDLEVYIGPKKFRKNLDNPRFHWISNGD